MSYNQPGPYGAPQQPQQPGPYGPGGAAGQPGYGYPQQPPAPAYGQPPQPGPYGQQPPAAPPYGAPQQGGWGQPQPGPYGGQPQPGMPGQYPPPVPPQSGGGKGKAIGITIGALVVVGAIVGGVLFFKNGGGGGGKVAPYTLVMPDSLLDGKFNKQQSSTSAATKDLANDSELKAMGITNGTGVGASYKNAQQQGLAVKGVYGDVSDPGKAVDAIFAKLDQKSTTAGAKIEVVTPVTEFHPSGFDGAVIKCESKKATVTMGSLTSSAEGSTCVWGDSSAVTAVSHSVAKTTGGITGGATTSATGNAMSAQELSEAVVKIRNEVRKNK